MEIKELSLAIEALLLASDKPLNIAKIIDLIKTEAEIDKQTVLQAIHIIKTSCSDKPYELKEVSSGYRIQIKQEHAPTISNMFEEKPQRLGRALLETLALIAYRQPITRGDIEAVRGVMVSTNIIKSLDELEWIRVVGHKDVPGRPALYATTKQFLDHFNLKSLDELPKLASLEDIDMAVDNLDDNQANEQLEIQLDEIAQDFDANKEKENEKDEVELMLSEIE